MVTTKRYGLTSVSDEVTGPEFIKRAFAAAFLIVTLLVSGIVNAASLEATVDRPTVIEGESVVLFLEGKDLRNTPDTSPLLQNFRIVHSGVSNSQSIVNGKRTSGFMIRLELQPKTTGGVTIPAFTVDGVSSQPVAIEIVARGTPGVEPRDKVFAELSVDNETPYVQEQVILQLKIYDDGSLTGADPQFTGTSDYQVEQLPLGREQIVDRQGVQYRVNTFRYAVFPQKSGDITIGAVTIPASVRDANYGGNLLLRGTPTRRIEVKTESLSLSVKPRASASTSGWWLPVKALQLKHEWSADISKAKIGEPFTLSFELLADGATSTQLPELPVPDVAGLKIYVDNPTMGSSPDADSLVSARREKWSVIPNREGLITLPEIVVKWWNTTADVEQRAVIPAQEILVAGAAATDPSSLTGGTALQSAGDSSQSLADQNLTDQGLVENDSADSNEVADSQADTSEESDTGIQSRDQIAGLSLQSDQSGASIAGGGWLADNKATRLWFWLAIAAMLAWLTTLLAWWWSARARRSGNVKSDRSPQNVSEQKALREMRCCSSKHDATAYSSAVLEWANARWDADPVHNLPEVGVRLGSHQLAESLRQLDHQRYARMPGNTADQSNINTVSLDFIQKEIDAALKHHKSDAGVDSLHALPQL